MGAITIIDGAPWWANLLLMLLALGVFALTSWWASDRGIRKGAAAAQQSQEALSEIQAQMKPNHGSSTRDAIDRMEANMDHLVRESEGLGESIRDLHKSTSAGFERLAAADAEDRKASAEAHQSIWEAIRGQ